MLGERLFQKKTRKGQILNEDCKWLRTNFPKHIAQLQRVVYLKDDSNLWHTKSSFLSVTIPIARTLGRVAPVLVTRDTKTPRHATPHTVCRYAEARTPLTVPQTWLRALRMAVVLTWKTGVSVGIGYDCGMHGANGDLSEEIRTAADAMLIQPDCVLKYRCSGVNRIVYLIYCWIAKLAHLGPVTTSHHSYFPPRFSEANCPKGYVMWMALYDFAELCREWLYWCGFRSPQLLLVVRNEWKGRFIQFCAYVRGRSGFGRYTAQSWVYGCSVCYDTQ